MDTKTKSLKSFIVLAMAWLILLLKSIRYWSSSDAVQTLPSDFSLLCSVWSIFNCFYILSWTLYRHLLIPAAWLQITLDSHADFSYFIEVSLDQSRCWGCWRHPGHPGYLAVATIEFGSVTTARRHSTGYLFLVSVQTVPPPLWFCWLDELIFP